MSSYTRELEDFARALDAIGTGGADDLSRQMLNAAANVWVNTSKALAPRDTGQLIARTDIAAISDKEVTIVVDTPYASYQEHGTRHVPAVGFFKAGEQAALDELGDYGSKFESIIEDMIDSGGYANPRKFLRDSGLAGTNYNPNVVFRQTPLATG